MNCKPTVFVVDDDEAARESVRALVESMGVKVLTFGSAESLLGSDQLAEPGCVVTDMRMLGMSGLELQEALARRGMDLPVIIITAYAETSLTVEAIKKGAVTLLEKPCRNHELWEAISKALVQTETACRERAQLHELRSRFAALSLQEREVLDLIVAGKQNKAIAAELGVSVRTVEARRQKVFKKTHTESVAELVRLVLETESDRPPTRLESARRADADSPIS